MKNNKNITISMFASVVLLIIFSLSLVSAFSVSSPYMGNNTLTLFTNSKTTELQYVLQNGGGATENVMIRVAILEGSEIANLTDESNIYTVIPGEKVPVNLKITLPENATSGDSYNIKLEFSTVTVGQSGQFGFGTGQEQSFKVIVEKEIVPESNSSTYLYLIVGILLIAFVIVLLLIKRRNTVVIKRK